MQVHQPTPTAENPLTAAAHHVGSLPAGARPAVVLLNLGGPVNEADVRTFLRNLFTDPDIIKLGGGFGQRLLANTIVKFRAPKVAEKYKAISACKTHCEGPESCPNRQSNGPWGCCSPINPLTEAQRQALEQALKEVFAEIPVQVYSAMRYGQPDTTHVQQQLKQDGVTHVLLLPLYPHFSWTTTGSSLRQWQQVKTELKLESAWEEIVVNQYPTHPRFIKAINARIDEALAAMPPAERAGVQLFFSAHGTPIAEVNSGDPYTHQIRETVEAVMQQRNYDHPHWLGFQSRVGPAKWTEPNTEKLAERLMNYGLRSLVVIPVAFVTDHIETLMELQEELREVLEPLGLRHLSVTAGLNTQPDFMAALTEMATQNLTNIILATDENPVPKPEPAANFAPAPQEPDK